MLISFLSFEVIQNNRVDEDMTKLLFASIVADAVNLADTTGKENEEEKGQEIH